MSIRILAATALTALVTVGCGTTDYGPEPAAPTGEDAQPTSGDVIYAFDEAGLPGARSRDKSRICFPRDREKWCEELVASDHIEVYRFETPREAAQYASEGGGVQVGPFYLTYIGAGNEAELMPKYEQTARDLLNATP